MSMPNPPPRVCPCCESFLTSQRSDAVYCSDGCRVNHHRGSVAPVRVVSKHANHYVSVHRRVSAAIDVVLSTVQRSRSELPASLQDWLPADVFVCAVYGDAIDTLCEVGRM